METITEILIDLSGSMNDRLEDGTSKIALTQRILLEEMLPALHYSHHITIHTFSSDKHGNPVIELLLDLANATHDNLIDAIQNISEPSGSCPADYALVESIRNIRKYHDLPARILLFTDGHSFAQSDESNIAEIPGIRPECPLFITAIGRVPAKGEKIMRHLAAVSKGAFVHTGAHKCSAEVIHLELEPLKIALSREMILQGKYVEVRPNREEAGNPRVMQQIADALNSTKAKKNNAGRELAPSIKLHIVSNLIDDHVKMQGKIEKPMHELLKDYDDFVSCLPGSEDGIFSTLLVVEYFDSAQRGQYMQQAIERVNQSRGQIRRVMVVTREWNAQEQEQLSEYADVFKNMGMPDMAVKLEGFPLFKKL